MTDTDRKDPPLVADEATSLRAFLDYHRDTLRWKTSGLTGEQLAQAHPPSTMTLGGMLKHLALVECNWFEVVMLDRPMMAPFDTADWEADPDWEWHSAEDDSPEQLRALFDEAVRRADSATEEVLAGPDGLDTLSVKRDRRTDEGFTMRWVLLHMIQEYARHNEHADLIREAIDGETGE